jgi:hypothetical protein
MKLTQLPSWFRDTHFSQMVGHLAGKNTWLRIVTTAC